MKVFFWESGEGGSVYYRSVLPAMAVRWHGHDVARSADVRAMPWPDGPDVIVGSRVSNPGPVGLWERIRKDSDATLILDLDDDYLHIDETSNPRANAFWDVAQQARLLKAVSLAHRVTVASEGLADVMRRYHDDVVVVPNGLHAAWLSAPRDYHGDGPVRIGWAGTSSTIHELPLAAKALNRILDYRDPRGHTPTVTTIGVPARWVKWAGLDVDRVQILEMIPNSDRYLVAAANHFDIWVAPYRDIPFNNSKVPTKALEAGFLGIPIVASSIRPYEDAVDHGATGFLVRQSHEWGRWLKRLVDNPDLRQSMGLAARARASAYIMQGLALDWVDAMTVRGKVPV
jgi:glycosyltransferase involved in cell wall biosynthesis